MGALGRAALGALLLACAALAAVVWRQTPVALFGWPAEEPVYEVSPQYGGGWGWRPQALSDVPIRARLNRLAAPWPVARDRVPQPMYAGGWGAQGGQEGGVYELVPAGEAPGLAPREGLRQVGAGEPYEEGRMPRMLRGQEAREEGQDPAADGADAPEASTAVGGGREEGRAEALAGRLRDPQDRQEAAWLMREDAAGHRLAALVALRRQKDGTSESQLKEEDRELDERLHKGRELERTARAEMQQYHRDMATEEARSRRQVQYLRATHNYAAMAQGEMADAAKTDEGSERLVAQSEQVLKAAHLAEVKARVTGNARELAAARASVGRDLAAVQGAEQGMARAAAEKKDAAYNAYMSRVLNRVRAKGSRPAESVGDLAKLGEQAHRDMARARDILGGAQGERARIERLLANDRAEDQTQKVVRDASRHSAETLKDMGAIEGDRARLEREHRAAEGLSARARTLDAAARKAEAEAAQAARGA